MGKINISLQINIYTTGRTIIKDKWITITKDTWRIDCERRMDIEVFNIFHRFFPQYFPVAGLHISLSDILDKEIGLGEQSFVTPSIQMVMFLLILHDTKMARQTFKQNKLQDHINGPSKLSCVR